MDVKYPPQMADQTSRRYLFVAIDPVVRQSMFTWVRGGDTFGIHSYLLQ
jgi:hypothetical protein